MKTKNPDYKIITGNDLPGLDVLKLIDKTNETLTKYINLGYKLDKELSFTRTGITRKNIVKNLVSDVIYSYFSTEGLVLQLKDLFDKVPELNNYAEPVSVERIFGMNDNFLKIKFYGFKKASPQVLEKAKIAAKKGVKDKRLNYYDNGLSAIYKAVAIAQVANRECNKLISNRTNRQEIIDNLSIEFSFPRDLINYIKYYYILLFKSTSKTAIVDINSEEKPLSFSDVYPEHAFIDKYFTEKLKNELAYQEQLILDKLLSTKYQLMKDYIERSCQYLLDTFKQARKDLYSQANLRSQDKGYKKLDKIDDYYTVYPSHGIRYYYVKYLK